MRNFIFIAIFLAFIGLNIYVCRRIVQLLPATNGILRIFVISAVAIGTLGMFAFFLWGEKMPVFVATLFYTVGTSWLIAFVYLFLAFLLIDLGRLLNHFFHFMDKETVFNLLHTNWKTLVMVLGGVAVLLISGNLNYHHKKRIHLSIETPKWNASAKPLRIVAVSDLHLGYTISKKELAKWVSLINTEKPDVVLIGGDLIDNALRPLTHHSLDAELRKIQAPMGVYACPGNHEFITGIKGSVAFYEKAGITLLRDSAAALENLRIIGRDDYTNKRRKPLSALTNSTDSPKFTILLDHQPHNLNKATTENIDFQFSGHTHRGQIFPISLITDKVYELSHGYKKKANTHFYVSSGLGIWGGKFRIGTQSEYVVIDVSHTNKVTQ